MSSGLELGVISHPGGGGIPVKTAFSMATLTGANTIVSAVSGKRIKVWDFKVIARSVALEAYFLSYFSASTYDQISQKALLPISGSWEGKPSQIHGQDVPALATNVGDALSLNLSNATADVFVKYTEED